MQLADCTFLKVLLSGRDVFARRQVRYHLLSDPPTIQETRL